MAANLSYTTEDVESALQLLALTGSTTAVERELGIARTTIDYWRDKKHAERYAQIRAELMPKIHAKIAAMHEDAARLALEKQMAFLERLNADDMKQVDVAGAVQKLAVTTGVHTDKSLVMRDKPTQITEHRSLTELAEGLARRAPHLFAIDADAIEDADVVEDHALAVRSSSASGS